MSFYITFFNQIIGSNSHLHPAYKSYLYPMKDLGIPLMDSVSEEQSLLNYVNLLRENHNLNDLFIDDNLNIIAETRLNEMVISYSHTRPNGEHGYDLIDSSKWRGENLAKNYYSANEVLAAWCNSQPHLENLIFKEYTKVGIKCDQMSDGSTYWVMMFSN
ncbi:MAG: CAP domain-containing protein [Lachnospiraceae bacterium]